MCLCLCGRGATAYANESLVPSVSLAATGLKAQRAAARAASKEPTATALGPQRALAFNL